MQSKIIGDSKKSSEKQSPSGTSESPVKLTEEPMKAVIKGDTEKSSEKPLKAQKKVFSFRADYTLTMDQKKAGGEEHGRKRKRWTEADISPCEDE